MSAQPAWLRNGLTHGVIAVIVTLVVNLAGRSLRGSDFCHPGVAGTLPFVGFGLFVIVAALAGRATALTGQPISAAALAGLVVGAVAAIAGLVLLVLALGDVDKAIQCAQAQTLAAMPSADVFRAISAISSLVAIAIGMGVGAGAGAIGGLTVGVREQTS